MRPTVPADLSKLSIALLSALSKELRTYQAASIGSDPEAATAEQVAEAQWAKEQRLAVKGVLDGKKAAVALADEANTRDDGDDDEAHVGQEESEKLPATAPNPAPPAPHPVVEQPVVEPPAEEASARPVNIPTTTGAPSVEVRNENRSALAGMVAAAGVEGKAAGEAFNSWAELSHALAVRGDSLASYAGSERFAVARVRGEYGPERMIDASDTYTKGLAKFERSEEITAALCAPGTPYYGLSCASTLRRPVFNSMGQFAAPRGKVSIPVSPTLADITNQNTGYGQWTFANDDDGSVKNCATVACNSWNDYQLYAIWRCLTVKNLMALTYPELVEAYLNRLGAAQARMAEVLLLEAMATGTTSVQAPDLGYGTATSFTSLVLEYFALYQEQQRWDIADGMEAWMPRWVQAAMKVDLIRRRTTNGNMQTQATDGAIDAMLRNVGINPHWFIDTPSWAPTIPAVQTGGNMNRLPTIIPAIVAPAGKFAVIDRGNLTIGVTGNNIYRDNSSNRTNTYTFFVESFEGLVNTDSCPAHLLRVPVCHNGVQVGDRLVDCQGADELGFES